jgi:hypothetical protein
MLMHTGFLGRVEDLGKRMIGRRKSRREDNIKMELKYVGCEGVDWTRLTQGRVKKRAFEKSAINLRGPSYVGNFLTR